MDGDVLAIAAEGRRFKITLEGGAVVSAGAVVIALGTARKKLGVPGEKELFGRGVSYCVECDCIKKRQTNVSGIYAAGDITRPPWQVV